MFDSSFGRTLSCYFSWWVLVVLPRSGPNLCNFWDREYLTLKSVLKSFQIILLKLLVGNVRTFLSVWFSAVSLSLSIAYSWIIITFLLCPYHRRQSFLHYFDNLYPYFDYRHLLLYWYQVLVDLFSRLSHTYSLIFLLWFFIVAELQDRRTVEPLWNTDNWSPLADEGGQWPSIISIPPGFRASYPSPKRLSPFEDSSLLRGFVVYIIWHILHSSYIMYISCYFRVRLSNGLHSVLARDNQMPAHDIIFCFSFYCFSSVEWYHHTLTRFLKSTLPFAPPSSTMVQF